MFKDDEDLDEGLARLAADAPLEQEADTELPPDIKPAAVIPPAVDPAQVPPRGPVAVSNDKPDLQPYGMRPPPEVKRDRLGEVASTLLGIFAGKDKHARRAALAGGLSTMISSKPGEEVEKENYDRKLLAARLAQRANAPTDPLKAFYAQSQAQRLNWDMQSRDVNSDVSKRARQLFYQTNPQAYPEGSLDQFSAADLAQFKQVVAMPAESAKQERLAGARSEESDRQAARDFEIWKIKEGITNATERDMIRFRTEIGSMNDKDLALFRASLSREDKASEKERERGMRGLPPGAEEVNPSAWQAIQADETQYRKVIDSVDAYSALVESLENMIKIREEYGAELPGHAQALFDSFKTNAVGAYTKLGESGTLNDGEWERYSAMIPSLAPDRIDALSLTTGKDLKLEQLKGVLNASRRVIDSRLRSKGVRFNPAAPGGPSSAPAPKPTPRRAAPVRPKSPPVVKSAADLDDL